VDVKFAIFRGEDGKPIKRYQYTAIENATRVRALKVYNGHEFEAKFYWHVEDQGTRHAYIKPRSPHSMARSNVLIVRMRRSFTSSPSTRMASISRKSSLTGCASTNSPDLTAPSIERYLTKRSGKIYRAIKDRLVDRLYHMATSSHGARGRMATLRTSMPVSVTSFSMVLFSKPSLKPESRSKADGAVTTHASHKARPATVTSTRGLHSTVRAGACTTPAGFAARAGAQAKHALTFKPGHPFGTDQ
jgi:hypothetical protein